MKSLILLSLALFLLITIWCALALSARLDELDDPSNFPEANDDDNSSNPQL